MEAWIKKTAEFAVGLILGEKKNPSVVPYRPSKTELLMPDSKSLPRSTPKRAQVSCERLIQLIDELEKVPCSNVHSLMVLKDGSVVSECSAPGYEAVMPHLSHSMSKVLTALAVGLAVDDGRLSVDTPVFELFPEYVPRERRFSDIKVHHLLTMSSGVRFAEAGVVSESEWTRAFFESELGFSPGSRFEYNSMNTYVLARIVTKVFGMSLTELLRERILNPLGIDSFFWECGPEDCEKGGFGAYMSLEAWAKIGILVKNGGVFGDRRIISREWIELSTSKHMDTPESEGRYAYGYQIWVSDDGYFLFSGMLGQSVLINPNEDIIIAVNSGNSELFQSGASFSVIDRAARRGFSENEDDAALYSLLKRRESGFFKERRWITPRKKKPGLLSRIGLSVRTPYPKEWETLLGKFDFADNNVGLLPVFIRTMQNSFGNCISDISFVKEGGRIFFVCRDGGRAFRLEVGFYDYAFSQINVSGERYRVGVMGGVESEGERFVCKLEIIFPEMPNVRRIEIREVGDGAFEFKFSETPDGKVARTYIDEVVKSGAMAAFVAGIAERRLGDGFLSMKLSSVFSPALVGAKAGSPNYERILEGERERARAGAAARGMLESFILRRFDSSGQEGDAAAEPGLAERLSGAFGRIKDIIKKRKE